MSEKTVEFEVSGGLCRIKFDPGYSTGRSEDTNPGVSFTLIGECAARPRPDGKFYHGMGVFARADAARLRDMLTEFLEAHPPA